MHYLSKCTKWRKLRDFEIDRIIFPQILSLFSLILLFSIYISMLFCKFYSHFREEKKKGEREFSIVFFFFLDFSIVISE
jgi:hypothetical protein